MSEPPASSLVFGIQAPSRDVDLRSISRYGELRWVFDDPSFQPSLQPGLARILIEERLSVFRPETDYVFSTGGDLSGILMVGKFLQLLCPDQPTRFLRWDRKFNPQNHRVRGTASYVPTLIR